MKLRIYLDTSVISAAFDNRNPERKVLTEEFFNSTINYKTYISELTLAEIDKTNDNNLREKMKLMTVSYEILKVNDEMKNFCHELISYGAVSENSIADAYHIAIAVVSGMDYLLSWNFRHIVRLRTKDTVRMITTLKKYKPVEIITPAELI